VGGNKAAVLSRSCSQRLKNAGLRHVGRVTLVACRAALADPTYEGLELARMLHFHLGRYQPSVRTHVAAYRRPISVVGDDAIANVQGFQGRPWLAGKKIVHGNQNTIEFLQSVRQQQKIVYYWNGNQQAMLNGGPEFS